MSIRTYSRWALVLVTCLFVAGDARGQAGKATPAARPAAPAAKAPAAPAKATDAHDEAKKKEILASARWRRAMFEYNEWLTMQQIYDEKQVAQFKKSFNARVAKMTSNELEAMLNDMDAKLKILESQPAKEAGQWLGQYLSILSDKKREEVVKEMPNLGSLTPTQLSQEIWKIQRKRQSMMQSQAAFDQGRQAQVDAAMQAHREAQAAMRRDQQLSAAQSYTSPYRPSTGTGERPFEDINPTGPKMSFYVSPWGGVGYFFSD